MTSTPVMVIAVATLLFAGIAAWLLEPRYGRVSPEASFKTALARRLVASGVDQVARRAPWHPLGLWPERLLVHPGVATVPGPHPEGFEAFVERLAAAPDPLARWAAWSQEDGLAARLSDDLALPADQDPRTRLGPAFSRASLADGAAAREAERRWRLRWRWLRGVTPEGVPDVAGEGSSLAERLPDGVATDSLVSLAATLGSLEHATPLTWALVRVWGVGWSQLAFRALQEAVGDWLRAEVEAGDGRIVLGVTGAAAPVALAALADDAGLRDGIGAVVSVAGAIRGRARELGPWGEAGCEDRLQRDLKHAFLDTEVVQRIPWAHVVWLDPSASPPGVGDLSATAQRWPEPGFDSQEPPFVEIEDLGALDVTCPAPPEDVREAVRVTVDLLVGSRTFV